MNANRIKIPAEGISTPLPTFSGRAVNVLLTRLGTVELPFAAPVASSDGGTLEIAQPQPVQVALAFPNGTLPPNCTIYYQVFYWVGGARFSTGLTILQPGLFNRANIRTVFGNRVQVVLYGTSLIQGGNFGSDQTVYVAMYPVASYDAADRFAYQWGRPLNPVNGGVPVAVVDNTFALPYLGGGILTAYKVDLLTAATGNEMLWGQWFDTASTATIVNGSKPIAGAETPPMAMAEDSRNMADPWPGSMPFYSGLCFALSKTSGTYTAPDGAPVASLQCEVGQ